MSDVTSALSTDGFGGAADGALVADVVTTIEGLEALADAWTRLAGADADPMQSPAWSLAAARTLHPGASLAIVTVRRKGTLVALAPLVEATRHGVQWLEVLGARHLGEAVRLLADGADARRALVRAILDLGRPVFLQCLDRGVWSSEFRAAARRRRAVSVVVPGASCLRAELGGDFGRYAGRVPPKRRAALRRQRSQLERANPVQTFAETPTPATSAAALDDAFAVEARSWKRAAGSAVALRPAHLEFFREIGRRFAAEGQLLIRGLRVGGEYAATNVSLVIGDRCYDLKIGYDERWARWSPGLLLTWHCLEDDVARGIGTHEFLGSREEWQLPYATAERPLENIVIYSRSLAGFWSLALDGAGVVRRRLTRLVAGAGSRRSARLRKVREELQSCAA